MKPMDMRDDARGHTADVMADKGTQADIIADNRPGAAENAQTDEAAQTGRPKRHRRRAIVLTAVVVALVVAGVGLYRWHATPEFCGAICHTPMDGYVETYEAVPGQPATDKWGNHVADASGMYAAVHRAAGAEAGEDITCMSCHVPSLTEQVTEGKMWVTGDFDVMETKAGTYVSPERDLDRLVYYRGADSGEEFCLNGSCHDLTREQLTETTSDLAFNPHSTQHGEYSCDTCHKAHRASVMYCTQCHDEAEVPEGWLTWDEYEQVTMD